MNILLISFDVVNLYRAIPYKYGIKTMKCWLPTYTGDIPERVEKCFIVGVRIILENNFFNFGDIYRQV